jgi:hypothetical protein
MPPATDGHLHREFVSFCLARLPEEDRAWPRLYDEMCNVARGRLFRDWGYNDLFAHGISLGLGGLSALQGAFFSAV